MDRQIVYSGAIVQDKDVLNTQMNAYKGMAYLAQAILGTNSWIDGMACNAVIPAGLKVIVSAGSFYSVQPLDTTNFGTLNSDTSTQIVKQGILPAALTINITPPAANGTSQVFLVQVGFQEVDTNSQVLPYYNKTSPSSPLSGPNGSGSAQNTTRADMVNVVLKAGTAAPTGSQLAPTPDVGYTGLFLVTVANGATTITSNNIVQIPGAPFITPKLPAIPSGVQTGAYVYAQDTSNTNNVINASLSPVPASIITGMAVRIKMNTTTQAGNTTLSLNGGPALSVLNPAGNSLVSGTMVAGRVYEFVFDGSNWQLISQAANAASGGGSGVNFLAYQSKVTTYAVQNTDNQVMIEMAGPGQFNLMSAAGVTNNLCIWLTSLRGDSKIVCNGADLIDGQFSTFLIPAVSEVGLIGITGGGWRTIRRPSVLIGEVRMFAGPALPIGYLTCDGTPVSRVLFNNLFTVIGTTFGAGDGATTFNLPDLRSRMPIGAGQGPGLSNRPLGATGQGGSESHTLTGNELPAHVHPATVSPHAHTFNVNSGTESAAHAHTYSGYSNAPAFAVAPGANVPGYFMANPGQYTTGTESAAHYHNINGGTDATTATVSIGSTGGGAAFSTMSPFLPINFIIKY